MYLKLYLKKTFECETSEHFTTEGCLKRDKILIKSKKNKVI